MLQCRRNEPVIGGPCWTERVRALRVAARCTAFVRSITQLLCREVRKVCTARRRARVVMRRAAAGLHVDGPGSEGFNGKQTGGGSCEVGKAKGKRAQERSDVVAA